MMKMNRRLFAASAASVAAILAGPAVAAPRRRQQLSQALAAMRRATRFMTDKVAVRGGYVWTALPDLSRRWGEMEAKPTMIWVQPPGTATMGHAFLDAFHATGEEMFWRAAESAADALVAGQHPAGGWNYMIDFAGEASLADWYDTVGRSAWRLEEFQHNWGNATFDDATTTDAATLLLRMAMNPRGARYKPALESAIKFVVDAQYPMGGWPQRFPLADPADYTTHITFNDDVAGENIKFLVLCYRAFGDAALRPVIARAMDAYLVTQQKAPQAGWGLQHAVADLKPAAGRSYEPAALVTHTTANNVAMLMTFYEMTGDAKYLARIPEALDWLESVALPADEVKDGRTHPTFIEVGSNRALYVHRFGSNVVNGEYFVNYDPEKVISHYAQTRAIDLAGLKARYETLKETSPEDATRGHPLVAGAPLPRFFTLANIDLKGLGQNRGWIDANAPTEAKVRELVHSLNFDGYWPTPLVETSRAYTGPGSSTPAAGDFSTTRVGDASDTSPFITNTPMIGISMDAFIRNMAILSQYVDNGEGEGPVQRRWFD